MIYLYAAGIMFAWILSATFLVGISESIVFTFLVVQCVWTLGVLTAIFCETKRHCYNHFILSLCILWFVLWVVS